MSTSASNLNPATPGSEKSAEPASRGIRLVRPLLAVSAIGVFFFLFHAFPDRAWLGRMDPHVHNVFHMMAYVSSALTVAVAMAWMILKKAPALLAVSSTEADWSQQSLLSEADRLKVYAMWFIAMRWIAVLFAAFLVFVCVQVLEWLPAVVWSPLVITIAALAGFNLLYTVLLRRGWRVSLLLAVQGYIDLAILVVLLHFSGGIENTFSMMMIFQVIIGGVLLSRRQCYGIAATASLLYAAMAFGEWSDVIGHYKLNLLPHVQGQIAHNTLYMLSWVLIQALVLFLTAYFVATIAERIRADNHRLEHQRRQYRRQVIAATEEERKRVARELHDHTGQSLTSLIAQLTVMIADADYASRRGTLVELRRQVEQIMGEVHELAHTLRPSSLDDLGLLAALEKHCRLCSARLGITVECEAVGVPDNRRFPSNVEVAVYRIAQEGITNAVRHGRARSVAVLLQRQDGKLLVVVEDDGVGFDAGDWRGQCARGNHLGLLGIEERAAMLGGTFRVESHPGSGARLFVEIPLKDGEHA